MFRGKRVNGEWVYGGIVHQTDCYGIKIDEYRIIDGTETDDNDIGYSYAVEPSTIGQYAGMTDKSGVKIFEGDIVKTIVLDRKALFEVCYGICGGTKNVLHEVGYIGFYLQPAGKTAKEYSSFELRNDIVYWIKKEKGVEIVGNIHDNPELLN